jgi:cysteine desulfuration protein SufE
MPDTRHADSDRRMKRMSLESLERTAQHFESLEKDGRIQALIALADGLLKLAPEDGERWDVKDIRKDLECQDVVGLFVRRDGERVHLAAEVGQEVTTLTRALTALFVENLNGEQSADILAVDPNLIPRVVGESLMRQRSNSAYYTLRRLKEAVRALEGEPIPPLPVF